MPPVRRIAKRAEIRVVRRHDDNAPTWRKQPVELFHGPDHIGDMFDDVNGPNFAERAVIKREWKMVEIGNHIRLRIRVAIQADRTRIFVDAAANV